MSRIRDEAIALLHNKMKHLWRKCFSLLVLVFDMDFAEKPLHFYSLNIKQSKKISIHVSSWNTVYEYECVGLLLRLTQTWLFTFLHTFIGNMCPGSTDLTYLVYVNQVLCHSKDWLEVVLNLDGQALSFIPSPILVHVLLPSNCDDAKQKQRWSKLDQNCQNINIIMLLTL